MSECADLTYYQRNRDVILNRAKDYYENDKERLRLFFIEHTALGKRLVSIKKQLFANC